MRSMKHCLCKFVGRAQFSFDELVTGLAEIESIINLRPLTYMPAKNPPHIISSDCGPLDVQSCDQSENDPTPEENPKESNDEQAIDS